jgi:hypothetical protein
VIDPSLYIDRTTQVDDLSRSMSFHRVTVTNRFTTPTHDLASCKHSASETSACGDNAHRFEQVPDRGWVILIVGCAVAYFARVVLPPTKSCPNICYSATMKISEIDSGNFVWCVSNTNGARLVGARVTKLIEIVLSPAFYAPTFPQSTGVRLPC